MMTTLPSVRRLRRTELLLMFLAALCAGYCLLAGLEAVAGYRSSARFGADGERSPIMQSASLQSGLLQRGSQQPALAAGKPSGAAEVMGHLEIAEISLSVPILSDFESSSLLKGVGHIPGTALPGGLGTLGLAGHRDTYFRPLRNIRKDMTIRVVDQVGAYRYVVDSTEVVKPEQVEVLDIGSRPGMTLITCYPFNFVGAAPLRFIVHAHLVSVAPDSGR